MELTAKQNEGLNIALERYKNKEKYVVISGYAGSGKSTLVRFIIEALGVSESQVCYATFTGKAAEVLRKKGNENAMTLHKLLYKTVPLPDGSFRRTPKDIEHSIIVIDECSMVPQSMVDLILSPRNKAYVIFLGDPFQLPPISSDEANHLLDTPHIFLDEIMRQAQDSEIIRISMDIRAGKPLNIFNGNDVKIFEKSELSSGMLQWADQVLCATNATRQKMNTYMRQLQGRGDYPEDGDKVICLKNDWDCMSLNMEPLVNGSIGYLENIYNTSISLPYWMKKYSSFGSRLPVIGANIRAGEDSYENIMINKGLFVDGVNPISSKMEYMMRKQKPKIIIPEEFTYGYAITVHKAQGSQWDNVLVIEENFPFSKEEHARWLYTAVTRAAQKMVLIKK